MKRTLIAAGWVAGSTIPLLAATVFVFGCCVLPFHGVIHRMMPFCQAAAAMMSGAHHHDDGVQPPTPAREKQEPVKRLFTEVPGAFALASLDQPGMATSAPAAAYRSFLSLGAMRCDRDVGLHALNETFLI